MGTPAVDKRTGTVRLKATKCDTCIFRPGNLMHLRPGRLRLMVSRAAAHQGYITCHDTLGRGQQGAICRGFADGPAKRNGCRALMLGTIFKTIKEV